VLSKRTLLKKGPVLLMMLLVTSCQTGISWRPDFFVGDYETETIVNEDGITVYSNEILFNEYGCLHKDQIKELREILRKAKIPKKNDKDISRLLLRLGIPKV